MAIADLKGGDPEKSLNEQQDLVVSKVQFSSKEATNLKQLVNQTDGTGKTFLKANKKSRTMKKKKEDKTANNSDYDHVLDGSIRVAGVNSRDVSTSHLYQQRG